MKKKALAGFLVFAMLTAAGITAFAATTHYNDSAVTGNSAAWQAYNLDWNAIATDYTKVSITPGEDETELHFAWYSLKTEEAATPTVHFGTDTMKVQLDHSDTDGMILISVYR